MTCILGMAYWTLSGLNQASEFLCGVAYHQIMLAARYMILSSAHISQSARPWPQRLGAQRGGSLALENTRSKGQDFDTHGARTPPFKEDIPEWGHLYLFWEAGAAPWHLRPLQYEVLCQWNNSPLGLNHMCSLSLKTRRYLEWWRKLKDGGSMVQPCWTLLTTYASLSGWGAHLDGILVQGTWNVQERVM